MLSNVVAERGVLAGIYQYGGEGYLDIADIISENTFTIDSNQIIFKVFKHILDKDEKIPLDLPSVYAAAKELSLDHILMKREEKDHLQAVINLKVNFDNIRKLAAKIRKLEIARLIRNQLGLAQEKMDNVTGDESSLEIVSIAEDTVLDFSSLFNDRQELPQRVGDEVEKHVEYLKTNPVDQIGIPSGFPRWDAAIGGGIRKATVNLISSRMKIGKTTCGINIGYNVASKNIPVLFLDTEMVFEDTLHKLLGLISKVPLIEIETGKFTKNAAKTLKIKQAVEKIKTLPYYHKNISGKEFETVLSIMRRFITRDVGINIDGTAKDCLIIYDYVKLMDGKNLNEGMKEYQELGFILTALQNFAVRYKVGILGFCQQNREGLTKDDTGTIGGSDRLLQYCSNCSIFKMKTDEEIAEDGIDNGNRKIIPLICRHGPGLSNFGDYINVNLQGWCGKVTELKTKNEIMNNNQNNNSDNSGFIITDPPNPSFDQLREHYTSSDEDKVNSELDKVIPKHS